MSLAFDRFLSALESAERSRARLRTGRDGRDAARRRRRWRAAPAMNPALTPAELDTRRRLLAALARAEAEHWPPEAVQRLEQTWLAWLRQRRWQARAS